jgi:hypothetical protein
MHNYQIELEQKKTFFVKAKNKTDARKKAKERMNKEKFASRYFKIDYIEENDYYFFM